MFWIFVHGGFAKARGKVLLAMDNDEIVQLIKEMPHSCEIDVLRLYPQGVSLQYLGDVMGLTRERVRQIQEKAIEKLKVRAGMRKYQSYRTHRKDTYGLDSADPYTQSLPNMLGVGHDTRRRAGNGRWAKYHGDGRKPKVEE